MKQKMKRFMAGFLALLTVFTTLFSNGTTAFAASSSANISFWYTAAAGTITGRCVCIQSACGTITAKKKKLQS